MSGSLYVKFSATDTGARPIVPCGAPNIVWENQSLWLSDPSNGSTLAGAKVGKQVNINATVSSESATFTPDQNSGFFVQVQIWVCDFTLAIGPKGGVASAGGSGGLVGLVKAPLSPSAAQTVTVQWTPQPGDLTNIDPSTGNGHLCLGANCFWEGTDPGHEGADLTDPTAVLDICGDQHQGQRNIAILPPDTHIKMKVWNFGREPSRIQLAVNEFRPNGGGIRIGDPGRRGDPGRLTLTEVLGLATTEHLLGHPAVTLSPGAAHLQAASPGTPAVDQLRNAEGLLALHEPIERAHLVGGGQLALLKDPEAATLHLAASPARGLVLAGSQGRGHSITEVVDPRHAAEIDFTAPSDSGDRPGAVHVFDLTQRAPNGRVLGGARIVTIAGTG